MFRLTSSFWLLLPCLQLISCFSVPRRTDGGIHLPLVKRTHSVLPRQQGTAAIGLGDVLDVTYNILVQVGQTETPLVLDTGSADLWVISDACIGNCTVGIPLYPHSTFQEAGMDVHLLYGDSHTGTHAYGPIGKDTAGIAGLTIKDQYFAAIVDTNTTVLETGSAGIFGLGFPAISVLWRQLLQAELATQPPSLNSTLKRFDHIPPHDINFRRPTFPTFDFLLPPTSSSSSHPNPLPKRQSSPLLSSAEVIASFGKYGPLPARLINENLISSPMIAVTLQRDTLDVGGNVGMLSIGELPIGIDTNSLTWVPLRGYSVAEGGLPPAPESPNEVYPLVWEIPIDDVYFDGVKLARSTLSSSSISLSALIDTGNSLIRGPQDVIEQITRSLGGEDFDCAVPHNLTFQIGGKLFPMDPRDFIHQSYTNTALYCNAALAVTDPPGVGFLYSWSLGDPFLKSVLAAFYYGNLTHPSKDPPRIGLLSTLPTDSGERLQEVVQTARESDGNFVATSEPAPSGTFVATTTGVGGVPQATRIAPEPTVTRSSSAAVQLHPATTQAWSSLIVISITILICITTGYLR